MDDRQLQIHLNKFNNEILEILELDLEINDEEEHLEKSPLYDDLKTKNRFVEYTNFSENQILGLYYIFLPEFKSMITKGSPLKLSILDHLISLLLFYKTGYTYLELGLVIKINSITTIRNIIKRSRNALFYCLSEKWSKKNRV